jgi:hypothetical protein
MRLSVRTVSAAAYTLSRSTDKGVQVQFSSAATVTLPDPNDQTNPDPTKWWQPGDVVLWEARAASLVFKQWNGTVPANALGHDRAFAQFAEGWAKCSPDPSTGDLTWILSGITKGPPTAGSTIQRTAYWASAPDKSLPSTDTAQNTCVTLSHPFSAGERWLYLATFGFYGAGGSSNQAIARAVMQGASDVEVAHAVRPRFAQGVELVGFVWGNTFGASPGSQTVRIDAANAVINFQTVVASPFVVGLRLETDESYVTAAGPVTDTTGTLTTAATLPYSGLPADEYEVLWGMDWSNTITNGMIDLQIVINGNVESPITCSRGTSRAGYYSGISPVALSGTGSILLQFRRDAANTTGTTTAANATIAILRKSRFQQVDSTKSAGAQSYTDTVFASKANKAVSLQSGFYTLVIGGFQGAVANAAGTDRLRGQLTRNGALLAPIAELDANLDGTWCAVSALGAAVVTPQQTTDVLDLSFASADGVSAVQAAGASIVALALRPSA